MMKQAYGYADDDSVYERFDPLYYGYESHDPTYVEKGVLTADKFKNLRKSIQQFSDNISGVNPDLLLRFSSRRWGEDSRTTEEMLKVLAELEQRSKGKDWDWDNEDEYEDEFPWFYSVENRHPGGWFSKKPKIDYLPDKVWIALMAALKGEDPDYSVLS